MLTMQRLLITLIILLLTACVNLPSGPSVMTLPGTGKSFDQFRADDYECRQYAYGQVGGTTAQKVSQTSGVQSAAVGTGLGAASGALIGGGGEGAAIGAGVGLVAGGLAGSGASRTSGYASQHRYDISYIQCMYAKGHRVPVSGNFSNAPSPNRSPSSNIATPPPGFTPPPPPPGNPPPAPPQ